MESSTEEEAQVSAKKIPEEKKSAPPANKPRPASLSLPRALSSSSRPPTPTNQMQGFFTFSSLIQRQDSIVQSSHPLAIQSPTKPTTSVQSTDRVPTSTSLSPSSSFNGSRTPEYRLSTTGYLILFSRILIQDLNITSIFRRRK